MIVNLLDPYISQTSLLKYLHLLYGKRRKWARSDKPNPALLLVFRPGLCAVSHNIGRFLKFQIINPLMTKPVKKELGQYLVIVTSRTWSITPIYCAFIRSPGDVWETYDSSEMRLNPELVENSLNRKEANFKKIKHMDEGEWKSSDMVSEVKAALDFTGNSSRGVEFSFPMRSLET